jgi:aldose 1-epimerase
MTERITLKNSNGASLDVINLGAAISALRMPDRQGEVRDIVLGYDNPAQYRVNPFYFGVVVGRVANRIAQGGFRLNQTHYQLARNQGHHHLHGGAGGFHRCLWSLEESSGEEAGERVTLNYFSKDGEENYPGNLSVAVNYCLTEHNELVIEYSASCDQQTIVNLTQHSYFNLAGHDSGDILNHLIRINADQYTPTGADQIPTGEISPVANTPLDLRRFRRIGDCLGESHPRVQVDGGFDHNFVLRGAVQGDLALAAELYEPLSGRSLKVLTDQPGLQLYTGNFIDEGTPGKKGATYNCHAGLCLETQHYPDSPNKPQFPSVELLPGQEFTSKTVYQFGTN